jgi:hypothetical protein
MKLLIAAAAIAASALACAAPASAKAETYINAGYSFVDADDVSLGAIVGRFGWRSQVFGIEGEGAFGVDDDQIGGGTVELNSQFAVYGTATARLNDNTNLFARIGYGTNDIKASGGGASASASDESWNYGVGGEIFFSGGAHGVRGDYTHLDFNDGGDADVWTIAWVMRFK